MNGIIYANISNFNLSTCKIIQYYPGSVKAKIKIIITNPMIMTNVEIKTLIFNSIGTYLNVNPQTNITLSGIYIND